MSIMAGLLASWIALRDNMDESQLCEIAWEQYLVPECAAAWPFGYRIAVAFSNSEYWARHVIPKAFYTVLARAYAAVDPECVGGSRRVSHIGVLPRDMRAIVRGHLMQYNRGVLFKPGVRKCVLKFCGIAVSINSMPQSVLVNESGKYYAADYNDNGYLPGRSVGTVLGLNYMEGAVEAVSNCIKCYESHYCSEHIGYADELERGKARLVQLCTNPPVFGAAPAVL